MCVRKERLLTWINKSWIMNRHLKVSVTQLYGLISIVENGGCARSSSSSACLAMFVVHLVVLFVLQVSGRERSHCGAEEWPEVRTEHSHVFLPWTIHYWVLSWLSILAASVERCIQLIRWWLRVELEVVWTQEIKLINLIYWFLACVDVNCSVCLQFLNIKLTDITVPDPEKYPHMVRNCNIPMYLNATCYLCLINQFIVELL